MTHRYDAVLFDLLTALLDSWTLWNDVAGDEASGRRWRAEYLRMTYGAGPYRPYEALVAEAAATVGLDRRLADALAERYSELQPWPGAAAALGALAAAGIPLGVATNCSESLGRIAAGRIGVPFAAMVTAERAGFYKPDPHPYRLALEELRIAPERCLFVAGSAYDLVGAARVGLATWWHDRIGMEKPPGAPEPLRHTRSLDGLADFVLGG
jgi:2-haloalkanoic acid dehalogenase type II